MRRTFGIRHTRQERLLVTGLFYGASRSEAGVTQGQDIHLIGAGNSGGQAAMFFATQARSVTLVVRGESLEKSMSHHLIERLRSKPDIGVALNSTCSKPASRAASRPATCGPARSSAP